MNDATNAPDNEPEKSKVTSEPAPEEQNNSTATQPVKKSKSKKKLVLVLAVLVVILGVAAVVYFVTMGSKPKVDQNDTGYASATKFESASKLVAEATPRITGTVIEASSTDGLGGKTINGLGVYGVPSYKVGDRKYANLPTASSGAGYMSDSVTATKNYKTFTDFFSKNKFKLVNSGKNDAGPIAWANDDITYVSYATYESNNLLCMIWHADASGTPYASHVTSIGCGEKSSYEKAANALDQFYAAYTKGESVPSDKIVLGSARTGDSNTKGYKVAVVYQEDTKELDAEFEGLYYKAPGQNDWTYFMGSQGWLDCTEFNTDTLKKAFDGFNCYDKASDKIINVGTGTSSPDLKG